MKKIIFICLTLIYSFNTLESNTFRLEKDYISKIHHQYTELSSDSIMNAALKENSIGNKNKAFILYTLLVNRYEENLPSAEKKLCAKAANSMGIMYADLYNYSKGLKMYLLAEKICNEIEDLSYKTFINNNMGIIYCVFQDYEKASEYFEEFFNYQIQHKQYDVAGEAFNNLIFCAIDSKNTLALQKYLPKAEIIFKNGNFTVDYAYFMGKSAYFNWTNQIDSSLIYAKQSLELALKDPQTKKRICVAHQQIARSFTKSKNYESAIYHIHQANEIAHENNILDVLCENYRMLASIYEATNSSKLYINNIHNYLALSDSLYNMKEYGTIKDLVYGAQLEQTEEQINRLQLKQDENTHIINLQKTILIGSVSISTIILGLLGLLLIQNKKLKDSYLNLFRKNRELIESEKLRRYSTSSLNNEQKNILIENIIDIFENGNLHLQADFSLELLSAKINSNSKYVSQAINEHFKLNFTTVVNKYRINAACKLFEKAEYQNYTIEAIAQEVGFKNRTTFNPIFKKHTGITPSQYLQMCINS